MEGIARATDGGSSEGLSWPFSGSLTVRNIVFQYLLKICPVIASERGSFSELINVLFGSRHNISRSKFIFGSFYSWCQTRPTTYESAEQMIPWKNGLFEKLYCLELVSRSFPILNGERGRGAFELYRSFGANTPVHPFSPENGWT